MTRVRRPSNAPHPLRWCLRCGRRCPPPRRLFCGRVCARIAAAALNEVYALERLYKLPER